MRVFVTGATGFVGSAVVQELLGAGHQVTGLARSDAAVTALTEAGAHAHRGALDDFWRLREGAEKSDGVIHCGFVHDFSRFKESCELDRAVIAALGDGLAGTAKPLIVTSATALVAAPPRVATEDDVPPAASHNPRVASEQAAALAAEKGVRAAVLRLPPSTHGEGDHGFVPMLIGLARQKGVSAYIGDGQNVWPAVHRFDAAKLYRLALEQGAAAPRYHANAEQGVAFRDIAAVIGKHLNVPVAGLSPEDAAAHFGWFAHFAALDNPTSSKLTRERTGWRPTGPDLIADLDRPSYFES